MHKRSWENAATHLAAVMKPQKDTLTESQNAEQRREAKVERLKSLRLDRARLQSSEKRQAR
jgi:hypothetical protein